jgi:hypothetical protein
MLGRGTQSRSCNKTDHPEYQRKHQATFRPMRDHFPFPSRVPHLAAIIKYFFAKARVSIIYAGFNVCKGSGGGLQAAYQAFDLHH